MTTQREIKDTFWLTWSVEGKPRKFWGRRQNELPADVRMAFVDFVDHLVRAGTITSDLAARVTL